MKDVVARLGTKPGVEVSDLADSWEIRAFNSDGFVVDVTIPHDALEWFVTVRHSAENREVWSDWMDYYASNRETETALRSEMARDLEWFFEQLLRSKVRLVESRTFLGSRQRLEWRTTGNWSRMAMCDNDAS